MAFLDSSSLHHPYFYSFAPCIETFEVDPQNPHPGVTQDLLVIEDEATRRRRLQSKLQSPRPGSAHVNGHATLNHFDVLRTLGNNLHDPFTPESSTLSSTTIPSPNRVSACPTSLSASELQKRRVSSKTGCPDPLARIRRAALDIVTLLRELRGEYRPAFMRRRPR